MLAYHPLNAAATPSRQRDVKLAPRRGALRRFEAVERAALLPLTRTPRELAVWHTAKVHTDTHVHEVVRAADDARHPRSA